MFVTSNKFVIKIDLMMNLMIFIVYHKFILATFSIIVIKVIKVCLG
jgi:hypothetical protein